MLHWETNLSFPFNPRLPLDAFPLLGDGRPRFSNAKDKHSRLLFERSRKGFHLQHHNRMRRKYFLAFSTAPCFETEARDALL
ncbi:hypothetical protein CEXT_743461 [Caerostris extrusa]|uniref:Uncharacterized protein n=1 Tax=Caerostris extrusa TaxID=172846 RepID=A0AAV4TBL3_CAEEX|nr:hypothetical protein CEXT_743461 [Caerostris extrusa]